MPDNPLYRKGVIWRSRTVIKAFPNNEHDGKSDWEEPVFIPRGEHVMLLNYYMGRNYEESITILWKDRIYFVYKIDIAFDFNIDPKGYNSKKAEKNNHDPSL